MSNVTSQTNPSDFATALERKIKKALQKPNGKKKLSKKRPKSGKGL